MQVNLLLTRSPNHQTFQQLQKFGLENLDLKTLDRIGNQLSKHILITCKKSLNMGNDKGGQYLIFCIILPIIFSYQPCCHSRLLLNSFNNTSHLRTHTVPQARVGGKSFLKDQKKLCLVPCREGSGFVSLLSSIQRDRSYFSSIKFYDSPPPFWLIDAL